jgi:hypothetical protein
VHRRHPDASERDVVDEGWGWELLSGRREGGKWREGVADIIRLNTLD